MDLKDGLIVATSIGLTLHDHTFGKGSYKNIDGVMPSLVTVAELAIRLCDYDGTIIMGRGLRTLEQARDNVRRKTGILNSLHRQQADGFGHAIDLIPYDGGPSWDQEKCKTMARSVRAAAAILSEPIRQGLDWDQDGEWLERGETDMCHFESPKLQHMARAVELMNAMRHGLELNEMVWNSESVECPHCEHPLMLVKV